MPSLRTALMTSAIMVVALFVIVKFFPASITGSLGLNKTA